MSVKLSQCFLEDKNILGKIYNSIKDIKNKNIIEIGGGKGALTEIILRHNPKELIIIEKDRDLYELLKNKFKSKNVKIINKDIRDIGLEYKIVISSVPYHLTREILKIIIFNNTEKAFLILQREYAEKIINNKFLPIVLFINTFYDCKLLFPISKNSFNPSPKVHSAFFYMQHKRKWDISLNNYWEFLVKLCSSKNKLIKNVFNININKRIREMNLNDIIEFYKTYNKLS